MRLVRSLLVALLVLVPVKAGIAAPEGQMTWAIHISLAPTWFDPAETSGIATPFMVLYALHDALVKPMPGNPMAPSLAESWTASKDGFVYEFVLRHGARFHNGDPVTADDVKFSFERYRGAASKLLKEKVAAVEIVDPQRVRFRLKEPWPDFMTYYGSLTTGAGWIVPRKYLEKVGDDGFKRAPVGGSYPDIDGLFREQSGELDRKRREATLHRIQQLVYDKAMYAPIWELGFIHAQGPRVAESGLGLIAGWAFSAPYEDVKLKGK